jgi:methylglyoxal/glyoxal reductase
MINHLNEIIYDSGVVPAVNQVEFHPFLYQQDLLRFCENKRIQLEACSPLTRAETHPTILKLTKNMIKDLHRFLICCSLHHGLVVIAQLCNKANNIWSKLRNAGIPLTKE